MSELKSLKFEPDLGFQREAIAAITDIFREQQKFTGSFTVEAIPEDLSASGKTVAYGNELKLAPEQVIENVHQVQLRNGLALSDDETVKTMNFSVWMETGTGKTYVYLRTVFELNKLYGFTKFIVVVPSIAIKEGVLSSLRLMKEHFAAQYGNVPYDYFAYDSGKLNQVRSFAVSSAIQIMVINIQAFIKAGNIIHQENDKMLGKPIDFIAGCRPVVIVDEPQSVDSTPKAKEAMKTLNPLCELRYSATHRKGEEYAMMYRLDSIDASQMKLVKEIEVAEIATEASHNSAYVKLVSVENKNGVISAKLEIDADKGGFVTRKAVKVKVDSDLYKLSGYREMYEGMVVDDICCVKGSEYVKFVNRGEVLRMNAAEGDAAADMLKREQIRKTIEEHLEKEMMLKNRGIKVLSLFFIDRVENYRRYAEDGAAVKGKFAEWFEELYAETIRKAKYAALRDTDDSEALNAEAEKAHDGYFSIDKKGHSVETNESNEAGRANAQRGYELIMKNKTRLLSFEEPVRFLFSHSALKEGWDNPNVFQICTLNEIASDIRRRQMIGRGLRICVNQNGERVREEGVNRLTVMANESFASFAENLQKEIQEETGITFGLVAKNSFAHISVKTDGGAEQPLGVEKSAAVFEGLVSEGYITEKGKIEEKLKKALKQHNVKVADEFKSVKKQIEETLAKIAGGYSIKQKRKPHTLKLRKALDLQPDFKELWDRIKYKTTYRVSIDGDKLIADCAAAMKDRNQFVVTKPSFFYAKGDVHLMDSGVEVVEKIHGKKPIVDFGTLPCPDIIGYVQNQTAITRRTAVEILKASGRLGEVKTNPQMFLEGMVRIVREKLLAMMVDGIKYHKLSDTDVWAQSLFESEELIGYLKSASDKGNLVETANRGLYDYVRYDSEVEREFAESLDKSEDVKLFAKLPLWFKIPTPLGTYNPDWAVVLEKDGEEKLYFVVETKGTESSSGITEDQNRRI